MSLDPGNRQGRETPGVPEHDPLHDHWNEIQPRLHAQWGRISDQEWQQIAGDRDRLVETLRTRYSLTRDEARRQVEAVTRGWR